MGINKVMIELCLTGYIHTWGPNPLDAFHFREGSKDYAYQQEQLSARWVTHLYTYAAR